MITDEIMITMAATLSTTLVIMLLAIRNTVHKKRLRRSLDWLETAKHSKYDTAHFQALKNDIDPTYIYSGNSSTSTFKLSLKISFGIAVLLGFSWWTFQLFTKGVLIWAAVSGLFAVIGLILPFLIWREVKQREEIKSRAGRTLKQIEKNLKQSHSEISEQSRKPAASTVSIIESAPVTDTTIRVEQKIPIPEDSVLRRHVLTQLRTEVEESLFPRPADCVLLRHYEQLVESELENRLVNPEDLSLFKFIEGRESALDSSAPSKPKRIDTLINKPASKAKNEPEQITIPEDSVLQRHFISQLRSEIETEVYPRPTEATLQRHYDQLIEAELASHLKWNTNWIR